MDHDFFFFIEFTGQITPRGCACKQSATTTTQPPTTQFPPFSARVALVVLFYPLVRPTRFIVPGSTAAAAGCDGMCRGDGRPGLTHEGKKLCGVCIETGKLVYLLKCLWQ